MFNESKGKKGIRIFSYVGGLALMLAFFIFLGREWDWMIQNNGKAFTVAMLSLAILITTLTVMHMFNFNPYQWLRSKLKKK